MTRAAVFVFFVFFCQICAGLQCRDEKNKPVDWFVLGKIPKLNDSYIIPDVRKGRGYMYLTSNSLNDGWMISKNSIFDNDSALAYTLAPYYKRNKTELWLVYNDQPPGTRSSKAGGHTKGVVGGGREGGFWLVHSVPHFPTPGTKFSYPGTGVKYGQTFLCLSLGVQQLDSIGSNVLKYNRPHFYDKLVSTEMSMIYPNLAKAPTADPVISPPFFKKTQITTMDSATFQVFAKSKKFNKDLYEWLADDLRTDILSETWLNERESLPTECNSSHKIMNIKSISYHGINFMSSHDHSKWAISTNKDTPWVCIGDINRAVPQEKRGGGTVCTLNPGLWQNFHDLPKDVEPCPKSRLHWT